METRSTGQQQLRRQARSPLWNRATRPAELDDDEVGTPTSQGREAGDDPRIPVSAADQRDDGAVRVEVREGVPLADLDGRGAGENPAVVRQSPRHMARGDVGAGDEPEHLRPGKRPERAVDRDGPFGRPPRWRSRRRDSGSAPCP